MSSTKDEDDAAAAIEERIERLRRMRGWSDDTTQISAFDVDDKSKAGKALPRAPMSLVLDEHGPARRVVQVENDPFEIGSGEKAHLRLLDPSISGRHARIHWDERHYRVRDMHSTAGTFVNGEAVPLSHTLADGDELVLGELHFRLRIGPHALDDEPPPRPAPRMVLPEPAPVAPVAPPAPPPRPRPVPVAKHISSVSLTWVNADGAEQEVLLPRPGQILVGRQRAVDMHLSDRSVSARHCTIGWEGDDVVLRDLGSTNGSFVDDERVMEAVLREGVALRLGVIPVRVTMLEVESPVEADEAADEVIAPPLYHVVFKNDRRQVSALTLSPRQPRVTIGADDGEIVVSDRGLAPVHARLSWDDGALMLDASTPGAELRVNDRPVTGAVLVNGDEVLAAELSLVVVRCGTSKERAPQGASAEAVLKRWAAYLAERDPDLELMFGTAGAAERTEVCVWGDGLLQLDLIVAGETDRHTGQASDELMAMLLNALIRAGFPDTHGTAGQGPTSGTEISGFRADLSAKVLVTPALAQRAAAYAEACDLMRAVATLLRPA